MGRSGGVTGGQRKLPARYDVLARPTRLWAVLCLLLAGTPAAGVTIRFDYRFDSKGFFDDPARRAVLDLAAGQITRFIDDLAPVEPDGSNTWNVQLFRPDNSQYEVIEDLDIPADTITVFVGAHNHGSRTLAWVDTPSVEASGSQDWLDTIQYRGQAGATSAPATDFGPWGSVLTFNSNTIDIPWHFGTTTDGLDPGEYDFLTVAMHEMFHVLGFGPADSWRDHVSDGKFTGADATSVGSSSNPQLTLEEKGSHWEDGTLGEVGGASQEALLSAVIPPATRRLPTDLDRAALRDIGWQEALAGDTDFDRDVDNTDLQLILAADSFNKGPGFAWTQGDFDGDMDVDNTDLQLVLATGFFGQGPYVAAAPTWQDEPLGDRGVGPASRYMAIVPEPGTLWLLAAGVGGLALTALIRRRSAGR